MAFNRYRKAISDDYKKVSKAAKRFAQRYDIELYGETHPWEELVAVIECEKWKYDGIEDEWERTRDRALGGKGIAPYRDFGNGFIGYYVE